MEMKQFFGYEHIFPKCTREGMGELNSCLIIDKQEKLQLTVMTNSRCNSDDSLTVKLVIVFIAKLCMRGDTIIEHSIKAQETLVTS